MTDKLFKQVKFLDNNPEYYIVSAYAKTKAKVIKFPPNPSSFSLSIYNAVGSFSIPMIRTTNLLAKSLDNDLTNAQDWHVWRVFRRYYKIAVLNSFSFLDDGTYDRISSAKMLSNIFYFKSSF